MTNNPIDVFISHSAKDKSIAEALVSLLKVALNLPADKIRCTSVDGYRLPAGATTDEQLRQEIYDAKVFLGLLTPASLQSTYVLFELGARWGANLHLAPVLASGTTTTTLRGPLAGLNALSCDEPAQIYQLLKDTASILNVQLDDPSSYQKHIDKLLRESKADRFAIPTPSEGNIIESIFSEVEAQEFQYLAEKLNRKMRVFVDVYEKKGPFRDLVGSEFFSSNLIALILDYLGKNYDSFDLNLFNSRIARAFSATHQVHSENSTHEYGKAKTAEDMTHELQKYGLVRFTRDGYENDYHISYEFTEKIHRFVYWLEITDFRVEEISFEYLESRERTRLL